MSAVYSSRYVVLTLVQAALAIIALGECILFWVSGSHEPHLRVRTALGLGECAHHASTDFILPDILYLASSAQLCVPVLSACLDAFN